MLKTNKRTLTPEDVEEIQASIRKVIDDNQHKLEPPVLQLLEKIVDILNDIRLTVEFDHEQRLQAIEEYLQDL
jgi:hypothetical protein